MWVQFLGGEDPLEKEIATHSSILAMDGGAWWTIVYGVAKSWTRLSDKQSHPIVQPIRRLIINKYMNIM